MIFNFTSTKLKFVGILQTFEKINIGFIFIDLDMNLENTDPNGEDPNSDQESLDSTPRLSMNPLEDSSESSPEEETSPTTNTYNLRSSGDSSEGRINLAISSGLHRLYSILTRARGENLSDEDSDSDELDWFSSLGTRR